MIITTEYIAGFTDGEGYFGVVGRGPRITWGQNTKEVLVLIQEWLQAMGVQGYLYFNPARPPRRPNGIFMLNVGAKDGVEKVCSALLPYLVVKHQDATDLLQWIKDHPYQTHRGQLDINRLKEMAEQGFTLGQVASEFGCGIGKVYKAVAAHKIVFFRPEKTPWKRTPKGICPGCGAAIYKASLLCLPCRSRARVGKPGPDILQGRWSLKYDCCIDCGTTERKHISFGRCEKCRDKLRREKERCARVEHQASEQ